MPNIFALSKEALVQAPLVSQIVFFIYLFMFLEATGEGDKNRQRAGKNRERKKEQKEGRKTSKDRRKGGEKRVGHQLLHKKVKR